MRRRGFSAPSHFSLPSLPGLLPEALRAMSDFQTCLMREERLTLILRIGSIGRLKVFQGQGEDATIILIVKKHPSLRRILVHEGRRRQIRRHSLRDLFALRWHELLLKHFTPPGLTSGEYPVWLPSEFPPCHDRADEQD